jgi:DNA-binding response OmpR family regulator
MMGATARDKLLQCQVNLEAALERNTVAKARMRDRVDRWLSRGSSVGSPAAVVLDNHRDLADALGNLLRGAGISATICHAPSELRSAASAPGAHFDLAMIDVALGDNEPTGMEVAEELRRAFPDVQIVIVSGVVPERLADIQAAMPGVRVLSKPFTSEQVLEIVRAALPGKLRQTVYG